MSTKLIVGGGISGLIFNYYHPEFEILTPEVGGNFGKSYMIWMHDMPETRKLMEDVGIPAEYDKKSYIGYYKDGWIKSVLTPEHNLLLIQKKMSNWDQPVDKTFIPKSYDISTVKAKSNNYMKTIGVDLHELMARLTEKATIKRASVRSISDEYVVTDDDMFHPYKELVSTIPAPVFWSIYGGKSSNKELAKTFSHTPTTNIMTKQKPDTFDDQFEMVYYDDTVPYSRISHLEGVYAYEFTGVITKEQFQELYPGVEIVDYLISKYGRIHSGVENVEPADNITFLGRFAQWEFGVSTEHVVKRTLEYTK